MKSLIALAQITVTGEDAQAFLHQVTTVDCADVDACGQMAAVCSPKGRVVANFLLQKRGDVFTVVLPESMSAVWLAHCLRYRLRARVGFAEPVLAESLPLTMPWVLPETSALFLPQMIGLDQVGGLSFTKGCFPGQEVVARAQHLGVVKRHCYWLSGCDAAAAGAEVRQASGQSVGVVCHQWGDGIMAVCEDRAMSQPVFVDEQPVEATRFHFDA